jgi:hypothetical protein
VTKSPAVAPFENPNEYPNEPLKVWRETFLSAIQKGDQADG